MEFLVPFSFDSKVGPTLTIMAGFEDLIEFTFSYTYLNDEADTFMKEISRNL